MTDADFANLLADAASCAAAGRWAEAEAAYNAALALAPGHPAIFHNLGVLAARRGDDAAAVKWFGAALDAEPRYASAHYNRAVAFQALGRRAEAIADFARAASLDPGHYASHRALAFLLLAEGDRGRSLDHFARAYDLRRGEDASGIAAKSLDHTNRTKLRHDAAQFRYLARMRRDAARFEAMARTYESVGADFPASVTRLSNPDLDRLGENYNRAISVRGAPELSEGALGLRPDRDQIVRAFLEGRGAVSFDDLLTPRAFATLRRFLTESTIWHDFSHIGGFVASYLEDGLACPLLLQIVDELRAMFPDLLGNHPLAQAWSFKAVDPNAAIDVHGDDGAVSLNFWMTPASANLNPAGGGMQICLEPPPPDWRVSDYGRDRDRSLAFLEQNRGEMLSVPYRENRAVLFSSRLLHFSDRPEFAQGYENQRINVTLVFGTGAGSSIPG